MMPSTIERPNPRDTKAPPQTVDWTVEEEVGFAGLPPGLACYMQEGEVPGHLRCPFSYEALRAPVRLAARSPAISDHHLVTWMGSLQRPEYNPFTGRRLQPSLFQAAPELSAELDHLRQAAEGEWLGRAATARGAEPSSRAAQRRRADLARAYATRWLRHHLHRRETRILARGPAPQAARAAQIIRQLTQSYYRMSPAAARALTRACPDPLTVAAYLAVVRVVVSVEGGRARLATPANPTGWWPPDFRAASLWQSLSLASLCVLGASLVLADTSPGLMGLSMQAGRIMNTGALGATIYTHHGNALAASIGMRALRPLELVNSWMAAANGLLTLYVGGLGQGGISALLGGVLVGYIAPIVWEQHRRRQVVREANATLLPRIQEEVDAEV